MNIDSSIVYSVSQLNNLAKSYLERQCSHIVVKGEISSFKKYPSGYVYITIKDLDSEVNCVVFPNTPNISDLEVGYEFDFKGTLSIYTPKGRYQFIIESFKKNEVGGLWENYRLLKEKLKKEGLFDQSNKKEIPEFPFNIGLISSLEGAVIHDIENVFQRRSPHILMHVKPSRVQGADAALDIIHSITCFNKENFVDLIIIARGGGSFEDLNCFNSESLARTIANSNIPIVTAIGHETDFTIADFVSDLRAATPSVSAEIVSKPTKEILDNIKSYTNEIHYMISQKLQKYFHEYQNMKNNLKFDNLAIMIDRILDNKRHLETMLLYAINNKVSFLDRELKQHRQRMKNNDLKTILTKGFSIVFNKEGNIVSSINNVELDDEISIKLNKGKIGAKIIEK